MFASSFHLYNPSFLATLNIPLPRHYTVQICKLFFTLTSKPLLSAKMSIRLTVSLLLFCSAHTITCDNSLQARADCNTGYTKCSPSGAVETDEPAIGSALSPLYVDVVNSVQSKSKQARSFENDLSVRSSGGSLCCKSRMPKGCHTTLF